MRTLIFIIVAFALYSPQRELAQTPIESKKLGKDFVIIGELGVPLGTIVEINATIVAGRSVGPKDLYSEYLLKVNKVGNKSMSDPAVCEFRTHSWDDVKLAPNTFALYELKKGEKAKSLTDVQIAELERDYVGRAYHLLAYEQGMFTGVPKNLPKNSVSWQDRGFGFRSQLIVMRVIEDKSRNTDERKPAELLTHKQ